MSHIIFDYDCEGLSPRAHYYYTEVEIQVTEHTMLQALAFTIDCLLFLSSPHRIRGSCERFRERGV